MKPYYERESLVDSVVEALGGVAVVDPLAAGIAVDTVLALAGGQIAARALEEAADAIRHKQHPESVRQMLNRRAAEYRNAEMGSARG